MTILQSLTSTARGTVSALSNSAMYGGTRLGSIIGGILFSKFTGFYGVAFFTSIVYIISLLIYNSSGIFKSINKKEIIS